MIAKVIKPIRMQAMPDIQILPGSTIQVRDHIAKNWLASGHIENTEEIKVETTDASSEKVETATIPHKAKRSKRSV